MANALLFEAIAEYFKTISNDLIWATVGSPDGKKPGPRPDAVAAFNSLLMKTRAKAVLCFDPVKREPLRLCRDTPDCRQGEECIDGVCTPVNPPWSTGARALPTETSAAYYDEFLQPCRDTPDCRQGQECIDGVCVWPMGGFSAGAVRVAPVYTVDLRTAVESYLQGIFDILASGIGRKPQKLPCVRKLLIELYAGALKISGKKITACETNRDCPDGYVCCDGMSIPVPFRLVFHPLDKTSPPWE